MIRLTPPKTKPLTVKLHWYNKDNKWEEIKDNHVVCLMDLEGRNRFIFEVDSEKHGKFFIATHDDDYQRIVKSGKFPVIPADKILKFFRTAKSDESLNELLPAVATALHELGGKVVR